MIKLIVFILFLTVLFSAGIVKALAFLGALMLIVPLIVLTLGAICYAGLVRNARNNMS